MYAAAALLEALGTAPTSAAGAEQVTNVCNDVAVEVQRVTLTLKAVRPLVDELGYRLATNFDFDPAPNAHLIGRDGRTRLTDFGRVLQDLTPDIATEEDMEIAVALCADAENACASLVNGYEAPADDAGIEARWHEVRYCVSKLVIHLTTKPFLKE